MSRHFYVVSQGCNSSSPLDDVVRHPGDPDGDGLLYLRHPVGGSLRLYAVFVVLQYVVWQPAISVASAVRHRHRGRLALVGAAQARRLHHTRIAVGTLIAPASV